MGDSCGSTQPLGCSLCLSYELLCCSNEHSEPPSTCGPQSTRTETFPDTRWWRRPAQGVWTAAKQGQAAATAGGDLEILLLIDGIEADAKVQIVEQIAQQPHLQGLFPQSALAANGVLTVDDHLVGHLDEQRRHVLRGPVVPRDGVHHLDVVHETGQHLQRAPAGLRGGRGGLGRGLPPGLDGVGGPSTAPGCAFNTPRKRRCEWGGRPERHTEPPQVTRPHWGRPFGVVLSVSQQTTARLRYARISDVRRPVRNGCR